MFNLKNYPKSYGNTENGFYRLSYPDKNQSEMEKIESVFWEFINKRVQTALPVKKFKNYLYINSGWEWSVFKKNNKSIVKIPAQIFPEVSDKRYLKNTEFAYREISKFFPSRFIAKTKVEEVDSRNLITQEYIKGKEDIKIVDLIKNKKCTSNLKDFLKYSLIMLEKKTWLPDFNIERTKDGFSIRNIIFQDKDFVPKIIDFTSYYDVFRLYPQRTDTEVKYKTKQIKESLSWFDLEI